MLVCPQFILCFRDVVIRRCTSADRDAISALTEGINNRNSLMRSVIATVISCMMKHFSIVIRYLTDFV